MGLVILSLSQVVAIFEWSVYVDAAGGIIFVFGYVLIRLIAKEGRVWSVFDLFVILGTALIAVAVFSKLTILLWVGVALMAVPAIPHILKSVRGTGTLSVKSHREVSKKNRTRAWHRVNNCLDRSAGRVFAT